MTKYLLKHIDLLYQLRFSVPQIESKKKLWKILCQEYLQQYVPSKATVVDLGAGSCDFIKNINCHTKIAIDVNPNLRKYAKPNITFIAAPTTKLPRRLHNKVDIVFAACLLEHIPSKEELLLTFQEVFKLLKPGGRFIILNPNIRFSTADYWDYFDHLLPVSDRSVAEGLLISGYKINKIIPKFVPNTIKDRLPKSPFLLKIYLHIPLLFKIFGKQMLIIAQKPKIY